MRPKRRNYTQFERDLAKNCGLTPGQARTALHQLERVRLIRRAGESFADGVVLTVPELPENGLTVGPRRSND